MASTKPRRPRGTKEQTRQDLIDAATKVIRVKGMGTLTTVNVTQAAGLAQSGFYAHFGNMDECLQAAAKQIAEAIRAAIAERRQQLYSQSLGDHAATVAFYRSLLEMFELERPITEILLGNQRDKSPIGKSMRRVMKSIRSDFVDDLWNVGQQLGLQSSHREQVEMLAEFILGSVIAAGNALLDKRMTDKQLLAEELAAMTGAASTDLLQRCLVHPK